MAKKAKRNQIFRSPDRAFYYCAGVVRAHVSRTILGEFDDDGSGSGVRFIPSRYLLEQSTKYQRRVQKIADALHAQATAEATAKKPAKPRTSSHAKVRKELVDRVADDDAPHTTRLTAAVTQLRDLLRANRTLGLILHIKICLLEVATKNGASLDSIAEKLGVHREKVESVLLGMGDVSLRDLSDVAWALNRTLHFGSAPTGIEEVTICRSGIPEKAMRAVEQFTQSKLGSANVREETSPHPATES
jgi:DNA-binding phage protein